MEYDDTVFASTELITTEVISAWEQPTIGMPNKEEITDLEIKALVLELSIPDWQKVSLEEHFEENFALLTE